MSVTKAYRVRRPVLAVATAMTLGLAGIAAQGSALASTISGRSGVSAPAARTLQPAQRAASPEQATSRQPEAGMLGVRQACPAAKPGDASCLSLVRTNVRGHVGMFTAGAAPAGYGPPGLQSAYNLPSGTAGAGQTVAVVDAYDDPDAAADLRVYRKQYGLPACTAASGCFRKVNQEGQPGDYPTADPGWAEEESLDVDMVSAICPRCHILLVEANNNADMNLGEAVDEAVALGAKYVSNSYGGAEYSGDLQDDQYYDHPGVAITAAAGDSGYDNGSADAPNYPAVSQYVTAVGGTSLIRDPGTARGWSEAAWSEGGSGCSLFEPRPSWQVGTNCGANHMTADVSAVADPSTGVAVYDSYSESGWQVLGGTSVASPLIASVYALAGPPAAGSYPASYPYADPAAFNDVTDGSNGICTPASWCTAGPGYDGPTGLGTPDGVAGFFAGQRGTLTGTVTSSATRKPVAGAVVEADGLSAVTGSTGRYTLSVPAGTYPVTASDLGYKARTAGQVQVSAGQDVTENFRLRPVPTVTVTGTVTDGSGHGWPLLARISVAGTTAVTYSDPATGRYSVALPDNSAHTVDVDPVYPGYQQAAQRIRTGATSLTQDIAVPVTTTSCTAPGYAYRYTGTTQRFSTTATPRGWTVTQTPGSTDGWEFVSQTPPPQEGNETGGSGDFAWAGSQTQPQENTSLYSPVTSMTGDTTPVVQFDSYYTGSNGNGTGGIYVDVSTDGGKTWHTVFLNVSNPVGGGEQAIGQFTVPLPQAVRQARVQVRLRYTDTGSIANGGWEVDNVFLGNRSCVPSVSGGLLAGTVTDANTGLDVNDADVTSTSSPRATATTTPVPGDPALGSGFYWMFTPVTGSQQFQAAAYNYATQTATTDVAANAITQQNFTLPAGQLTATPGSLSAATQLGATTTENLTLENTGAEPVTLNLSEQPGSTTTTGRQAATRTVAPAAGWTSLPALPHRVDNNLVATDPATGDVYSVGGENAQLRQVAQAYVYQPGASSWTALPRMPGPDAFAVGGFVDGKLYVVGGEAQGYSGEPVWIYDPVTRQWSAGASPPDGGDLWGAAAVLGSKMYTIGGGRSTLVEAYDTATNTWSVAARYPEPIYFPSCGGFNGRIYCAGGFSNPYTPTLTTTAYAYDPATDTWSAIDSLPIPLAASAYTAANGQLLVSGGYTATRNGNAPATSRGFSYTPGQGWTKLPALPAPAHNSGSACGPGGLYVAGGLNEQYKMLSSAEVLPGYGDCGASTGVPWLSASPATATLNPGQSVAVTVTMNAGDALVTQPGTYTAQVVVDSNTPYQLSVPVTMSVTSPRTWGEVTGTVTDSATGSPIAGASVQVCTFYDKDTGTCGPGSVTYTLTTDADGDYSLWLDHRDSPVQVTVTNSGYTPQARNAKITADTATVLNFAMSKE